MPMKCESSIVVLSQTYFNQLASSAPRTTVYSHKSTIQPFVEYCKKHGYSQSNLAIEDITEYIGSKHPPWSSTTIDGKFGVLANFLSFLWDEDPEIVQISLRTKLDKHARTETAQNTGSHPILPNIEHHRVGSYLDYVRRRAYGTRVHVFTELVLTTRSRPTMVRKLDRENVDLDKQLAEIGIPESYAVSAYNVHPIRTVRLSSKCIRSLKTYLKHERVPVDAEESAPLFTTPFGRVSSSTLRRSIKAHSKTALLAGGMNSIPGEIDEHRRLRPLLPSDLWKYSLTQLIEE